MQLRSNRRSTDHLYTSIQCGCVYVSCEMTLLCTSKLTFVIYIWLHITTSLCWVWVWHWLDQDDNVQLIGENSTKRTYVWTWFIYFFFFFRQWQWRFGAWDFWFFIVIFLFDNCLFILYIWLLGYVENVLICQVGWLLSSSLGTLLYPRFQC